MSSDESFNYESIQDVDTIREFILSLVNGLESGSMNLSSNGDRIELHPSGMLKFSVKAKRKGQTGKVTVRISWKEKPDDRSLSDEPIKVNSE
jgi:amphi-Trp domain-containing protein